MKTHLHNLFNLVFPSICYACSKYEPISNEHLCLSCYKSLPFIHSPEVSIAALEGKDFFPESVRFYQSLFYYTKDSKVADMIHRIKYNGQYRIGRYLGKLLGKQLSAAGSWEAFTMIPVPIHPKRRKVRGYNQAEEIAKGISTVVNIPVIGDYLLRTRHESSQTQKDKYERSAMLDSSFIQNTRRAVAGKILLVDDVITTGSTINACVGALQKSQSQDIVVVSLGVSI